jgi:AcrR family transcriptional regulator
MPGAVDEHERRLLDGMAEAITEKGYAATTIADVVSRARVSKRTFYEHFADKEAAFLATYSTVSNDMLALITEAASVEAPWQERIEAGVRAYLTELAAHPALTRTFLVEIQAAGPNALALRREVMTRFARGLQAIVASVAETDPSVPPLPDGLATAIVGGINELLLGGVEEGGAEDLTELTDTASAFIHAVLTAPREPRGQTP